MNFQRRRYDDEPEINLIPLIDVLLVILIFLAATTSFTRFNQLQLDLPQASADAPDPQAMQLAISQEGLYALNGQLLSATSAEEVARALRAAAGSNEKAVLVINADTLTSHGSVVRVMEAARLAGIARVNFATQNSP
ncbi:biopolymer transporter ExbD [Pusillimonas sp. ANT_WB101]|uniref:ExbD/TolR family protein n=1 Tax=Pusillimonas sp. ANT_WB101 TaxID=2597356 RepID=UPI0011EE781A|nr:biopolymer transporter ExbD [Pusillimonas sp. ANT_WB101]KAA0911451.1 biopolymer transporter ExbD [Pusillimonas sp. ANT_WB101]NYT79423.1 biopolymer transporter ExbD [Alcaligenaceae bacterium]